MFVKFNLREGRTILLNSAKICRVEEKVIESLMGKIITIYSVIYFMEKGNVESVEVKEPLEEVERIINQALDHDASIKGLTSNESNG